MKSVDFVQPRHNYANPPEVEQYGHIYLPTSLHTAGARLVHAGVDVRVQDENLRPIEVNSDNIGINLLGAPYIPEAIKLQRRIQKTTRDDLRFILGGQVMNSLSRGQQTQLFGVNSVNGNHDIELAQVFGLSPSTLPRPESTSLIPVYEQISDEDMRGYLSREFSFYVSQGCNQNCRFCAAMKGTPEKYRDIDIIERDLSYLVARAKQLGLQKLEIYMSNLDVVQSPPQLREFARIVKKIRKDNQGLRIGTRGLATVPFFIKHKDKFADVFHELVESGFHTIGFGVDGWNNELYRKLRKGNTQDNCIEAIRSAKEDFGMTPEILMVFGHDLDDETRDTAESLEGAYAICNEMAERYGAIPRPHVSKSFVPGNEGWSMPENTNAINSLIEHPEAFQSLDFTALPSTLTHPDLEIRELASRYYLKICSIPGNTTQHVKPITPGMSQQEMEAVKAYNIGRYDR